MSARRDRRVSTPWTCAQRLVQRLAVRVGGAGRAASRRCRTAAAGDRPPGRVRHRRLALERHARLQPLGERGDQLGGDLDVGQRDQLHRRVHVAQRHRDERRWGRRPRLTWTASASVPVARPSDSSVNGMLLLLGGSMQQLDDRRVQRRAAGDHRARSRAGAWSIGPSSTPGWSVAKVTSTTIATSGSSANALVRAPAKRRLLLGHGQRDDVARARRRRRPPGGPPRRRRSSRSGCRARARRAGPLGSSTGSASITPASPIRTISRASSPSCGADVDVQVLDLRAPSRARRPLSRWIGLRPITPRDVAVAGGDPHPLADQDDRVPAADLAEAQVAVVVDVRDVHADLVDVPDHGQRRAAGGAGHAGHRGAHGVAARPRRRKRRTRRARPGRARSRGRTGRRRSAAGGAARGSAIGAG